MEGPWHVEVASEDFARFARSLREYEQVVLDAAIAKVLAVEGPAICESERGKQASASGQQREIAAARRVLAE